MNKLLFLLLLPCFVNAQIYGPEISGPAAPKKIAPYDEDSLRSAIIGTWYLSGTSCYDPYILERNEVFISSGMESEMRITKDSIIFRSISRFYNRAVGFHYTIKHDTLLNTNHLLLYQGKRKKTNQHYLTIDGDYHSISISEHLFSGTNENVSVGSTSVYYPVPDEYSLEQKLRKSWVSSEPLTDSELEIGDTLHLKTPSSYPFVMYESCKSKFKRENGKLVMIEECMWSDENTITGYDREVTCELDPARNELFIFQNDQWYVFSIVDLQPELATFAFIAIRSLNSLSH